MNPDYQPDYQDYSSSAWAYGEAQRNLWDPRPSAAPAPVPADPKRDSYLEFHKANPDIYSELRRLALRLVAAGRKRYGIASLFEVLRWHRAIDTTTSEVLKLNNNHRAYYARELMDREPELAGFFAVRASPGTLSELSEEDPDFQ